jgi:hypothetical protein
VRAFVRSARRAKICLRVRNAARRSTRGPAAASRSSGQFALRPRAAPACLAVQTPGPEAAQLQHATHRDAPGQRIRILFIDSWHSYEAVTDDIRNWVPFVTPTGVVVVDDYYNYDEYEPQPPMLGKSFRHCNDAPDACAWRIARLLPKPILRYLRIPWG